MRNIQTHENKSNLKQSIPSSLFFKMENTSLRSYRALSNGLPLPLNKTPWKRFSILKH